MAYSDPTVPGSSTLIPVISPPGPGSVFGGLHPVHRPAVVLGQPGLVRRRVAVEPLQVGQELLVPAVAAFQATGLGQDGQGHRGYRLCVIVIIVSPYRSRVAIRPSSSTVSAGIAMSKTSATAWLQPWTK